MERDSAFSASHIYKRKRISAFIIGEIVIQIGIQHFWIALYRTSVQLCTRNPHFIKENMLVAEKFNLLYPYGKRIVYTYVKRWYYRNMQYLGIEICFMYITGYNFLFRCTMIQNSRFFY